MLQRDQRAIDLGLDVRDVAAVVVLVLVADDDVAVSVVRGKAIVEEFDERRALSCFLSITAGTLLRHIFCSNFFFFILVSDYQFLNLLIHKCGLRFLLLCFIHIRRDNQLTIFTFHLHIIPKMKSDRKSTRLNSSHVALSRMPSSA